MSEQYFTMVFEGDIASFDFNPLKSEAGPFGVPCAISRGDALEEIDALHEQIDGKEQPRGCICPPTSEATCQGLQCPRRAFPFTGLQGWQLAQRMVVCPTCGNKRCPKASDHKLVCTNSNASGQAGSIYE